MIRQRFATRTTTKRAFVFDLDDNDKPSGKKVIEDDSGTTDSIEIATPVSSNDLDVKKTDEKVCLQGIDNDKEDACTPSSPLNCSEVLKEILKHPPLGTSTPRIAVPISRSKQPTHNPKSLFRSTVSSSKLTRCSPIRKFAINKSTLKNRSSPRKAASTAERKSDKNVPLPATCQRKIPASNSPIRIVPVPEQLIRNVSKSPVKVDSDVLESTNSPAPVSSVFAPSEDSIKSHSFQDPVKSVTAVSKSPRSTKTLENRSPKFNKVAKMRPREEFNSQISEVPSQVTDRSENEQTPSNPKVKQITLSKSSIKQISIDSDSPALETVISPQKITTPKIKKSKETHVCDISTKDRAIHNAKSTKTSKGMKAKSKVPREVKLLMEQCYKMENLKSHYHAETGEVEFEQYKRSHKPVCYNVDTMLSQLDKQSVSSKPSTKTRSKKDVYTFEGFAVGTKRHPKQKKSSTKNPKFKTTASQSKKRIAEDSGNSSSSFIVKRKKPVAKTISTDEDDDESMFIQKKHKVSQNSDSGYCKENAGSKDSGKNPSAVRSKRTLYTRNYEDLDYDISPSTSMTTTSQNNEKHLVKSMKHLVKKTNFHKMRKTSSKR